MNVFLSTTQYKVCANIFLHAGSWRKTSPRQNWKPSILGILSWDDWWGLGASKWVITGLLFWGPFCSGDQLLWMVPTPRARAVILLVLQSISMLRAGTPQHLTALMKTRSKPEFFWRINKPTFMTSSWPPNEVLITRGLAPLLYHNGPSQGAGGDNTLHEMQIQKN